MITKIMNGYDNPRRRCAFPPDYYENAPRPMTSQQKRTLTDLLCSFISDNNELERKLAEIEDYDFKDACEAIMDLRFMQCE